MTREEARQIIASWLASSKGGKGQCGYIEGWFYEKDVEAFRMAIEALQDDWIPVSERLPEYMVDMWDEGVIATVNGREGNIIYENGIVPDAWFEDGKWYVNDVELENAKVVAWQPLPEPYKGGEEE